MTKCYALQKDVFDINKVTVVGSPTISDDGVASGFEYTNNDYLKILDSQLQNSDNWEIKLKFTTGEIKTQYLISADRNDVEFSLGIWSENNITGYLFCWLTPSMHYNVPISELTIEANTTYYVKYAVTNGIFTVDVSYDDVTYKTCITKTLPSSLTKSPQVIGIGNNNNRSFVGSIDLTAFKIYVDNELVYSPTKPITYLERRKEGFDLSKFTVVGSPTITEDGVASGFSSGNYITVSKNLNIGNNWTITSKFTTPSTTLSGKIYGLRKGTTASERYGIGLGILGSGNFEITYANSDGTGWGTNPSTGAVSPNATYYTRHSYKNGSFILDVSTDGLNYVNVITHTADMGYSQFILTEIGAFNGGSGFNGSIDLSQFSITVDGEEVFTGAKEKFYAMKGNM